MFFLYYMANWSSFVKENSVWFQKGSEVLGKQTPRKQFCQKAFSKYFMIGGKFQFNFRNCNRKNANCNK